MKFIKYLLVSILVFYFAIGCVGGNISMPTIVPYHCAVYLIICIVQQVVEPFLRFLTIKCNFVTYFLMCTIALGGVLYLFDLFMPDFHINSYDFEGIKLASIVIPQTTLSSIAMIAVISAFDSFFMSLYRELDSK